MRRILLVLVAAILAISTAVPALAQNESTQSPSSSGLQKGESTQAPSSSGLGDKGESTQALAEDTQPSSADASSSGQETSDEAQPLDDPEDNSCIEGDDGVLHTQGTLVVKFKDNAAKADKDKDLKDKKAKKIYDFPEEGMAGVEVGSSDLEGAKADLESASNVESVAHDGCFVAAYTPNDSWYNLPEPSQQNSFQAMHAENAWDVSTGTNARPIAVLDDGCYESNPDLQGRVFRERDWVDNDTDATPAPGANEHHGTLVAGLIVALHNNVAPGGSVGQGIAGVAPSAYIYCERVAHYDSTLGTEVGTDAQLAAGIQDANQNSAWITNFSYVCYGGGNVQACNNSFTASTSKISTKADQMVEVVPSGNDGGFNVNWPCNISGTLCVGGTNEDATGMYAYSNRSVELDLLAPAEGVISDYNDTQVDYNWAGTSFASPIAAGAANLVKATHSGKTVNEVKQFMMNHASAPSYWAVPLIDLYRYVSE